MDSNRSYIWPRSDCGEACCGEADFALEGCGEADSSQEGCGEADSTAGLDGVDSQRGVGAH